MNIKKTYTTISLALLSCVLTFGSTWWQNPQLNWKSFTALPTLVTTNNSTWNWVIEERAWSGTPRFFAKNISAANEAEWLFMADASTSPTFNRIDANWSQVQDVNSTAMVKWDKPYPELFVGTSTGIWRFDEATSLFTSVWYWPWDPTMIISLGDSIYGCVLNYGSESSYKIWSPTGKTKIFDAGFMGMWADPVSKKYGRGWNTWVRTASPNQSIFITDTVDGSGGLYSTNGEVTTASPVGVRSDGLALYISDFVAYSPDVVIVKARYSGINSLQIGRLGGILYSLNCPTNQYGAISTLFYSPTTKLLVAGYGNRLYYAILPSPDGNVDTGLTIESRMVVSWSTQYSSAILESAIKLEGPWLVVTNPWTVKSDRIEVIIPKVGNQNMQFFRVRLP